MKKKPIKIIDVENYIKEKVNNDPDILFKKINFYNYEIMIIFSESLSNHDTIDNFILRYFSQRELIGKKSINNIIPFLESNIPSRKSTTISTYDELFYNLFSGFTIIVVDGEDKMLSYETRAFLNSNINIANNEKVIKGPQDAFTENYQINLGLIKRRMKSEHLWSKEITVGKISKTKVNIMYMKNIASKELVKAIESRIKKINIDSVADSNYIIDFIMSNQKNVFPNYLSTERPDTVSRKLLEGKVAIIVENSRLVITIPMTFMELFHSAEDYYQKIVNANYTRIIRIIAFLVTILTPAVYIAITTYNHEAIPSQLIINFSIQRDGVPFPSVFEALVMLIVFEILKETDARIPNVIGSSLSIVGALVLGQAAVAAGIVSPIMVIVIAITSISNFILSYFDAINGIRLWRLLFLLMASFAGIIGITIAGLILIINLSSISSLGVPYLTPFAPSIKKNWGDNLFLNMKAKFLKRPSYTASNNIIKGRE